MISVVTDTIPEKGLRTRTQCELRPELQCSWFHAVTNRYRPTSNTGGTLNKDLQVIRDLNRGTVGPRPPTGTGADGGARRR